MTNDQVRPLLATCLSAFAIAAIVCTTMSRSAVAAEAKAVYVIGYLGVGQTSAEVAHVLGFITPEGADEQYPDFGQANQLSWVFGPQFADGRRILLTSFKGVDATKVRSGKVLTHDWIYDLLSGKVQQVLQKNRPAEQMRTHALLSGDTRVIATAIVGGEERVFVMDLDGDNQVELTEAGGGFHYGLSLSNDRKRLAVHVTGGKPSDYNPGAYSINVLDVDTKKRVFVAGQPEHLLFGPHWSPDDRYLVYLDCLNVQDTGHFRAALNIGRTDGSGQQAALPEQTHWFGTPYGSNMSSWSPDGKTITYTRLLPNSTRDMSVGGAQLCLLSPFSGAITELTTAEEGRWDFRAEWSPSGDKLAFTRVRTGGVRELWIMDPDGTHQQRLTDGYLKKGADFARWIRVVPTETQPSG